MHFAGIENSVRAGYIQTVNACLDENDGTLTPPNRTMAALLDKISPVYNRDHVRDADYSSMNRELGWGDD